MSAISDKNEQPGGVRLCPGTRCHDLIIGFVSDTKRRRLNQLKDAPAAHLLTSFSLNLTDAKPGREP